ncbi:hypothetical protein GA707_15865 [Nostocoides sp. F2B08]|uniref:hypothetical protein n=1 Tax=Nostocoides sp. F2B08 TaxID=2653936 RepID=UPI00126358F1|nr:hypothetical protein [Tetrasphaera sp. F2B08]KAB7742384.1 hypothetical protein GA707_15865 [Tetrasphaera sp. F2B08]
MARTLNKALAFATPMFVSTVITWMALLLMPVHVANPLSLTGLALALLLLTGVGEGLTARTLLLARRPTPAELDILTPALTILSSHGLGPPVSVLRVQNQPTWSRVDAFGRRTIVITTGFIHNLRHRHTTPAQAAEQLLRAAHIAHGGLTRSDAFLALWTIPWQLLAGLADGLANTFRGYPLTRFFWRARFITIGIAVIQAAHDGYYPLAAFITIIGTLSYTAPAWIRRWERIKTAYGHHALAASYTSGRAHSITHLRPQTSSDVTPLR